MSSNKKINIIYRLIFVGFFILVGFFIFGPHNYKINNKSLGDILELAQYKNYFSEKKNKIPVEKLYFVQLGVFAKTSEVDKIRSNVTLLGFTVTLKKHSLDGKLSTKVIIGPYNEKLLKSTLKTLVNNNIKYYVINE